ncbi:hypothetical protein LCGC14_1580930 [marine sediment metagenome]|uniref:Uncharacterized protein n=1 Tax=marine sediment metagenome TaxID=412755 RepID=A0A0F9J304_9ZZZZ
MRELLEKKETRKRKMFQITHDKHLVYSVIKVTKLTRPIFQEEQPIEDLMFLWANKTVLPYIKHLETW